MTPLVAILIRDMRIAVRVGGGALMGVLFFLVVVTLIPFALGPDLALLKRIGPAILWLAALLASLLALDRLFVADHDDGSLDLILMGRAPLEIVVAAKGLAHWLTTGLPLVIAAPLIGLFLNLDAPAAGALVLTLLGRHAGADLHRAHWRRDRGDAPPRRAVARGSGLAAHRAGAHFRRRGRQCGGDRADPVRYAVYHPVCADAGEPGRGAVRRGGGAAAGNGIRCGGQELPMAISDLANPTRFLAFANRTIPWLGGLAVVAFAFGINQTIVAPDDYQQGATVKIMFLHVPGAWLGMLGWGVMTIAALGTLVWRHPLADVAAKATAPIGAAFTLMCLVTGSLWGRPMWGTYWVWDARLTSVLLLFLLYLGVIALWRTVEDPSRAARAAAILTLVGAIDLPIIKFSVEWWNTLHQPASVFRMGGPTIDASILIPLFIMTIAFTLTFATLVLAAMRNEILRRRVRTLRLMQASAAS